MHMQFPGHIFGAALCCAGHGLPSAAGDQKSWQQTAATYTDCLCALEALQVFIGAFPALLVIYLFDLFAALPVLNWSNSP